MKRILTTIHLGLLLISCSPKLYPSQTIEVEKSVTEKEIIRDTIIKVQPDSTLLQALIRCDSTGRARLEEIQVLKESSRIQQELSLKENTKPHEPAILTVKAKVDSMGIYLQYKERFKEETKIEIRETVIEKEVNVLTKMQRFLLDIGRTSIIFLFFLIIRMITNYLLARIY